MKHELINGGDGLDPYPQPQLRALVALLQDIAARRGIGPSSVKRHSDLDRSMPPSGPHQRRKVDPGTAFPFREVLDQAFPGR